jgi:hypothetical protein
MHKLSIIFNSVHEVSVLQILLHFWHYERQILDLKYRFSVSRFYKPTINILGADFVAMMRFLQTP